MNSFQVASDLSNLQSSHRSPLCRPACPRISPAFTHMSIPTALRYYPPDTNWGPERLNNYSVPYSSPASLQRTYKTSLRAGCWERSPESSGSKIRDDGSRNEELTTAANSKETALAWSILNRKEQPRTTTYKERKEEGKTERWQKEQKPEGPGDGQKQV